MSPGGNGYFSSPVYDSLRHWLGNIPPACAADPDQLNALCISPPLSGGGVPIRFVRPVAPGLHRYADQYEVRTSVRGEIPVRSESWHDTFNALAWLSFPRTKAAINHRHFSELERDRTQRGIREDEAFSPGGKRSASRDALTLFDESGILVASTDDQLLELIRRHRWKELFWGRRADVEQRMRFFVLGHAVHEKSMRAYKGITARALLLPVTEAFPDLSPARQLEYVDDAAARHVAQPASFASPQDLSPLPIMGIPGWDDNEADSYYDDVSVFR